MSKIEAETVSCMHCGDTILLDESISHHDDTLCADCAENHTTFCSRCGDRIWNSADYGDGSLSLCEHCRDDHFTTCTECDVLLNLNDAHYEEDDEERPFCSSCFDDLETRPIHNYSYKPEPVFFGSGRRFFGVELEVDYAGRSDDNARRILEILNRKRELGYIKCDGSLDDGMELVLHPMTLDFHLNQMPWAEVLAKFRLLGYSSHRTTTCGLHVHVNRSSLGETLEQQENTTANILYFFERFWEEMLRFSRRTENQVRKWAARYGYKQSGREILEEAKKSYAGRYTCVNLTNYNTIEFRIFRGTLKLNTILATLQLIDQVCSVAFSLPAEELQGMGWADFMLRLDGDRVPELVQYLKERSLYINDPVATTEEEA